MLKKFFVSMLGTMAGLWLSLIIFIFVLFIGVGVLLVKSSSTKDISGENVLYLDLTGVVDERESEASISDIMKYLDDQADDLATMLKAVKLAADDKNIKGIYINCGGASMGFASRGELIQALNEFKKSGKWVYAYADNYELGDYYVATAADSLYLNPVGMINVHGLNATVMFYKDVLQKLGIGIDVVRVGSFKSAVEPFLRMDMSPESRLQMQVFLGQIWDGMKQTIADARDLKGPGVVDGWADSLFMTWDPVKYVQQGAVTSLRYRSEVEAQIRSLMGVDKDEDLPLVTSAEYVAFKDNSDSAADRRHVAVLYAVGDIVDTGDGGIVSETMVPEIEALANDDNVVALVLRVNSPGGSAFASEQIWHALERFKDAGKKFYVSMSDYAASGGYYISCGADRIYCDPATLTGSIGIFGVIPNAQELLQKKIGLGFDTVQTNPNSDFPSLYFAPTADQISGMQQYVERGYDTFTSRVAAGRDIPVDSVKAIGGGRVWDGRSALRIGLVDELGSLDDCLDDLLSEVNLKPADVVAYPRIDASLLQTLVKESRKNMEVGIEGLTPDEVRKYYNFVSRIKDMAPVQARMETVILH